MHISTWFYIFVIHSRYYISACTSVNDLNFVAAHEKLTRVLLIIALAVFRYFSAGWVKEVMFHAISDNSPVCLLSCKVTPTMALRNKPYKVWIALQKDNGITPGRHIFSALGGHSFLACLESHKCGLLAVSYTHLTLPTNREV